MTRLQMRALVALLGTLAPSGCATHPAGSGARSGAAAPFAVRVDNMSNDRIDLYLVREPDEWHLGRLEPGATAWLPLPALGPAESGEMVWLAVIAGAPRSPRPSRDARAATSVKQPVGALMRQRWTFTQGQLRGL